MEDGTRFGQETCGLCSTPRCDLRLSSLPRVLSFNEKSAVEKQNKFIYRQTTIKNVSHSTPETQEQEILINLLLSSLLLPTCSRFVDLHRTEKYSQACIRSQLSSQLSSRFSSRLIPAWRLALSIKPGDLGRIAVARHFSPYFLITFDISLHFGSQHIGADGR